MRFIVQRSSLSESTEFVDQWSSLTRATDVVEYGGGGRALS